MSTDMAVTAVALLATYLVHSTVLLGGAAVLERWVARTEAWRETLWKAALVGAVVTASLSTLLPMWPGVKIALSVEVRRDVPAAPPDPIVLEVERGGGDAETESLADATAEAEESAPTAADQGREERTAAGSAGDAALAGGLAGTGGDSGPGAPTAAEAGSVPVPLAGMLAGGWAVVALLLLARLGLRHVLLLRALRGRRVVGDEAAARMLAELRRSAGVWVPVRLTASPAIASPLVLGRREICVPERFVTELGPEEQRAALAHELAHLARRDPAWQLAALVLERLFFFQPLQRVARRRLREAAEYLADGWAVQHGGGRLPLARCLVEVAGWVSPAGEPLLAGTVAMAEGGSPLMSRVRRLLEREPESVPRPAARAAAALAMVLSAAMFAPVLGAAGPEQEEAAGPEAQVPEVGVQDRGVVRAPAMPLVDGMRWAAERARTGASSVYWVAYAVDSRTRPGSLVSMDSGPWSTDELRGRAIAERLGAARELASGEAAQSVIVLARMVRGADGERPDRLAVRAPSLGIALDGVVYWLGRAAGEESMAWLEGVYESEVDLDLRETAVEAISVHPGDAATAFLVRVIETAAEPRLREQAVEGLEYHPSDATVSLLTALAGSDRQSSVREEAVEALAALNDSRATAVLTEIARGEVATSRRVRGEALEGLAQAGDTALARILLGIALGDPDREMRRKAVEVMAELPPDVALPLLRRVIAESTDRDVVREAVETAADFPAAQAQPLLEEVMRGGYPSDVRREALEQLTELSVPSFGAERLLELALRDADPNIRRQAAESLAELPPAQAVPLLRRIVMESTDERVMRQATESLGNVGTAEALAALDEILERNPSEAVSAQALEAIVDNFAREQVLPRLERLLREHPSRRVRREALEALADLVEGESVLESDDLRSPSASPSPSPSESTSPSPGR